MLDIIVIIILVVCVLLGMKKGIVLAVFDFFSFIISIILSKAVYPIISKVLLSSKGFNDTIRAAILSNVQIKEMVKLQTIKAQTDFINKLPLPKILLNSINENNNPQIYKILNVDSLQDYIVGFITNICANIIAITISFVVVFIAMKIISNTLNIVTKLPVIKTLNSFSGACMGFVEGVFVIWIFMIFITMFLSKDNGSLVASLNNSFIAIYFYENNFLMDMVVKVFA